MNMAEAYEMVVEAARSHALAMHPRDRRKLGCAIERVQRRVTRMRVRLETKRSAKNLSPCAAWHKAHRLERNQHIES